MNKDPLPSSVLKTNISPKTVFIFLIFMVLLSTYVINNKIPVTTETHKSFFDAEDRQKVFRIISAKQINGFKFTISTNSKGEISLASKYNKNILTLIDIEEHNRSLVKELKRWFLVKNNPVKKGEIYLTLVSK